MSTRNSIFDNDDIWKLVYMFKESNETIYQCICRSSLFKYVLGDGSVVYKDDDRVVVQDGEWIGWISWVIHEMYPITLPYIPESKPFTVFREEHGDSTVLLYLTTPDGERVELNRYFTDQDGEMVERGGS